MAPRLPKAKREELKQKAWSMSARGMNNLQIRDALGISHVTVGAMLEEKREEARARFPDADVEAMRTYDEVLAEGWSRLDAFPHGSSAQNAVGYLNAILGAQNGKNRVTGVEKPKEFKHSGKISVEQMDAILEGDE